MSVEETSGNIDFTLDISDQNAMMVLGSTTVSLSAIDDSASKFIQLLAINCDDLICVYIAS